MWYIISFVLGEIAMVLILALFIGSKEKSSAEKTMDKKIEKLENVRDIDFKLGFDIVRKPNNEEIISKVNEIVDILNRESEDDAYESNHHDK